MYIFWKAGRKKIMGFLSYSGGSKKMCGLGNPDRISELPESIILQILSFLEMKDVVKTCILSKRWKYLWIQVDTIVYKCNVLGEGEEHMSFDQIREHQLQHYISFIDNTLMQCVSNIKRFSFSGFYGMFTNSQPLHALVDKWIAYVLEKKVEFLKLKFEVFFHPVPDCLYQCSSLIELNLEELDIRISSPVNWTSLKSLYLKSLAIDDESLESVLLGCPVLETLVLKNITDINHLNIMSPRMKRLSLVKMNYEDSDIDDILIIRAPWLEEIEIVDKFLITQCQLVDLTCLMKATITFTTNQLLFGEDEAYNPGWNDEVIAHNYKWIYMVNEVLKSLCHVAELVIGSEILQVLSISKLLGKSSPLFKCKRLTIVSPLWKYDIPGIACLLESAPLLETLDINVYNLQMAFPLNQIEKLFSDEDRDLTLSNGEFTYLKSVKIDYVRNACFDCVDSSYGKFLDFELVSCILHSAIVLKKLVISSSETWCCICNVPNCMFRYVPCLFSKLLTSFLAENKAAEWDLRKRKHTFEIIFSNYASMLHKD